MSMTTTAPTATAEETEAGAALERVQQAIAKITSGDSISYSDLLKLVAPAPVLPPPPAKAPPLPSITDEQRRALARVVEVFGVVVPDSRRTLTAPEVSSLIQERLVLDEIATLAADRKDGIRTTVCNHLDCQIEEDAATVVAEGGEEPEMPPRDDKGHYVKAGKAAAPGQPKQFSREVRSGAVTVDPELLRTLADDPTFQAELAAAGVSFTHADYLVMTRQVRVVDEAAVMIALRQKPGLVHALRLATKAAPATAAVSMRKA